MLVYKQIEFRTSAVLSAMSILLLWFVAIQTVSARDVHTAIHPFSFPQPASAPDEFFALIEIPDGSFTKYEVDPDTGFIIVDRFQTMPVRYPANYGSIPSTVGPDGDPLDILVLSREPIVPGALIRVRPIGMLIMLDEGEQDDKIIAVPADDVDPLYAHIRDIDDLAEVAQQQIEEFFQVYKNLPAGRKQVETQGYVNANTAKTTIQRAIENPPAEQ